MTEPKTPPAPAAEDEELTPAEEKKFGKFLSKFLEEDDTPSPPPPTPPTPTPPAPTPTPPGDIEGAINRALDAREGKKATSDELGKLRLEIDALKPKPKKWHQPWTLFSGVM